MATRYAVWQNGVITRELPELPPSHGDDQYRFISDRGDVYGYIQSSVEDESDWGSHQVATVVRITSDGERSEWSLPDAQVDILNYSQSNEHRGPLATLLSKHASDLDESFKGLAERHSRVDAYLKGDRKDTIDGATQG
jgi:hypothetical protein